MQKALLIGQFVFAILMVASILLQQRGASLGSAFGGESSVYRSRRGVEKWLFYLSILFSAIFIILAIISLVI